MCRLEVILLVYLSPLQVVIYNRRDGGQDRLTGSVVTIGDNSAGTNNAQCGAAIANSRLMSKVDVYCEPALKGRYVHVKQMASGNRVMNLCEIKVYGIGGGNAPPKLTGAISKSCAYFLPICSILGLILTQWQTLSINSIIRSL